MEHIEDIELAAPEFRAKSCYLVRESLRQRVLTIDHVPTLTDFIYK